MLEEDSGKRITTAALARQVGVSEAALYRHFPSKARMFEGLIDFIEESIFARITRILEDVPDATSRCGTILALLLGFAEKNPGLARVMGGDVLTGETARLRQRVNQLFERLEMQLKQILREAELREGLRPTIPASAAANLLAAQAEGRISQYVRSDFGDHFLTHFLTQLFHGIFFELANTLRADAVDVGQIMQRLFAIG